MKKQKLKSTNNDIMFICQRDILLGTPASFDEVKDFVETYWSHHGTEFEQNFSHDNWKMVACWLYYFYGSCKPVPVLDRHTWRFWDNLPFFVFCKSPLLLFFLRPIIAPFLALSVVRVWKTKKRNGEKFKELTTSGDILAFFICTCFEFDWTMKFMTWYIHRHKDLGTWENIFKIYFTQPNNRYVLDAYREYRKNRLRDFLGAK